MKIKLGFMAMILGMFVVSACSPEVGSKEWCDAIKEKPKSEWNANEATEFTNSCLM